MPTYQVHLRGAATDPPDWDWVQTVVANNEHLAIQSAYIAWLKSSVTTWVPRLGDCQTLVTEIASNSQGGETRDNS